MKTWIFIGILIGILSGAAYYYYSTTQERMAVLIENNTTLAANVTQLTDANNQNIQTIESLQASYKKAQEDFLRLQSEFQIIRSQNNELRERLSRHELDALAFEKPELIERTINNASKNVMRCFEILSGAPLTENEMNAETARQANSECPWIFSDLKR